MNQKCKDIYLYLLKQMQVDGPGQAVKTHSFI